MSTTERPDALRSALVAAGRRLAGSGIHGAFRLARHPGAVAVSFVSQNGSATRITERALLEAVEALQVAGFDATHSRFEVVVALPLPLAA